MHYCQIHIVDAYVGQCMTNAYGYYPQEMEMFIMEKSKTAFNELGGKMNSKLI